MSTSARQASLNEQLVQPGINFNIVEMEQFLKERVAHNFMLPEYFH